MAITIDESSDQITLSSDTSNTFFYVGTGGLLTPSVAPTNGQLLIGSTGAAPVVASLTAGAAVSITNAAGAITIANTGVTSAVAGTGVSVSGGTGAVTFANTGVTAIAGIAGQITFSSSTGSVTASLATAGTAGTYASVTTDAYGRVTSGAASQSVGTGGTGLTTAPTNGQLLIGNGTTYTLANITGSTGLSVTNGAGTIALANTGVTSNVAGTGITISGGTGAVTITNSGVTSFSGDGTILGNSLSTGAVTATLKTAAAGTVLGNRTGAAAVPTYTSTPVLGLAGTTLGTISLSGNTSGTILIQPQAVAGSYNFNLPITAGTAGQPLLSGGGVASPMTFGTLSVAAGGTSLAATPTNGQLLIGNGTNYTLATLTAGNDIAITNAAGAITVAHATGGTAGTYTNATITTDVNGHITSASSNYGTYVYYGSNFENPNNADWAVNALAYATIDPISNALVVRAFNDTTETGVGAYLTVPTSATNMTFTWKLRPATAPGTTNNKVIMRLYSRSIPNGAVVAAWSGATNFTTLTIPNNTDFNYVTQTVSLATLGITPGNLYAFEITRQASITNNVVGLIYLIEFTVQFT
jgi:hypothetical protein